MRWIGKLFKKSGNMDTDINPEQTRSNDINMNQTDQANSHSDWKGYIKENGEAIAECRLRIEEAKVEYQAVTSYLTDMQKIDMIPTLQREVMEDAARNIINLNKERNYIRSRSYEITDTQYRLFEQYEIEIPKELTSIKEAESYQESIEGDFKHLEKEKQSLLENKEDIVSKQSFLRGIAIATCIVIIVLFIIFAVLSGANGSNMTLPFLLTVLMGMASALYLFMEARRNIYDIKLTQVKLSKIIMLSNKVAIKSVNNRNYLDYIYSKYMVDDYEHFKSRWEQYISIKDENKRYQSNSHLMEFYNERLIEELKNYKISDSEIWIYQPSAILDNREMVEVRHRLNIRRQKLRERIELNQEQKQKATKAIISLVKAFPDKEDEAIIILKKYQIKKDELPMTFIEEGVTYGKNKL